MHALRVHACVALAGRSAPNLQLMLRRSLLFEVVAGTAVARLAAGEELVVLKRKGAE